MHRKAHPHNSIFGIAWNSVTALMIVLLVLIIVVLFIVFTAQSAQAQTFTVIHNFTAGRDGSDPMAGLTTDGENFYGTTSSGGKYGYGTVFKLVQKGSAWIFTPLYSFAGGYDGANPYARVTLGPDGNLYGTTFYGGGGSCHSCGTVFQLRPPPTPPSALAPWNETVLHRFTGRDGENPGGDLIFDQSGSIYGTTANGGDGRYGTVYKLTPSDGVWTETVLHSFQGPDGAYPYSGVVFDESGSLYGVTYSGDPYTYGTVYELSPSGSSWTQQTLYGFSDTNEGGNPYGGLVIDPLGNLYGTTSGFGVGGDGTAFELTPARGGWTFTTLYAFPGLGLYGGPLDKLVMDAAGNLYGTTQGGGPYGAGRVFKLTLSPGGWTYTSLHDFTGGSDGGDQFGGLVFGANGNIYGATLYGGTYGYGVVWEITP